MRKYFILYLLILPALALASTLDPAYQPDVPVPLATGNEEVDAPVYMPPYNPLQPDGINTVGVTDLIGTTWYESQHNGTTGRMVAKTADDYWHFVWMNGEDNGATSRHIYYNAIDPMGNQLWPGIGYAVESSTRAGYTTLDAGHGGIAFPAFHQSQTNANFHAAIALDFFPHAGAFLVYEPPWIYEGPEDLQAIWPHMMLDNTGIAHMITTHSHGVAAAPQRQWYITGEYDPVTFQMIYPGGAEPWDLVAWTNDIAADVATSEVSNRVMVGWTWCKDEGFPNPPTATFSQWNNDIHLLIDDDGVDLNFENYFNLTQFHNPDPSWLPDTLMANMDTLRAYTDMGCFIDQDDWAHVVFTTRSYFGMEGAVSYWHPSIIWHWSEQFPGEFHIVTNVFDDWWWNYTSCGAWNVKAQGPTLGQDPETGFLYCTYQYYDVDTLALSAAGFPSGEVYISMSEDGGQNWSVGLNVTETVTPQNAAPGQCLSEIDPTMATIVDGAVNILYILDYDAGFVVQDEGSWTLNDVIYHNVPVDLIPSTPHVPQDVPFHVEHGPPVGIPGAGQYEQPEKFGLAQNYPNPFNPTTSIMFNLDEVSPVSLKVFNLRGEQVALVTSGTFGTGEHTVTFDGSNLASGLYIYRLEAGNRVDTRKMVLLK